MKNIIEMKDEELMIFYEKVATDLEELEAAQSMIKDEFMDRLDAQKVDSKIVGDYSITKVTKNKIKLDLDKARELGCTKTEETVDTTKANSMLKMGVDIPHETYRYLLTKKLT